MLMRFVGKQLVELTLLMMLFVSTLASAGSDVETVHDLKGLEEQASSANLPVLLLFTAEDCDYCEAIRTHYLEPMIRSGKYDSTILFRQLYIDEFHYVRNQQEKLISGDQIALKYNVDVTPTILFVNAKGKELADRIVGLSGADYFDELLSSHISQAQSNFQK